MSELRIVRLVLDQGVPRDAASQFRKSGYDCVHAGEVGMGQAADNEILAYALEKAAAIVTLDADFHAILAVSRAAGPSVIRLRLQGLGGFRSRLRGGARTGSIRR